MHVNIGTFICTDSQVNECLTTVSLIVFTQRNFIADFLQAKCDFTPKTAVFFVFEPPFEGLRVTYDDYLRLILKRVVDLLVLLRTFLAWCYG